MTEPVIVKSPTRLRRMLDSDQWLYYAFRTVACGHDLAGLVRDALGSDPRNVLRR